jgi:hypothetical protein
MMPTFGLAFAAVLALIVTPVLYAIFFGVGTEDQSSSRMTALNAGHEVT